MSARSVDVGDCLSLHATREGSGTPLLLLHGFTGAASSWDLVVPSWREAFDVIAVDLPGHGASAAPADEHRYALGRLADDLARLLDVLDVPRACVLGYSLGGRAALRFALAHPDRVAALVLESTSPGITDAGERRSRALADRALADLIQAEGVAAFVDRWERLPLWESQSTLAPAVREALRRQRLRNDARGLANSLRGAGAGVDEPLLERLPALAMPALVVAGELDAKYASLAGQMAARLPDARLEILPAAGHAVHLERPDAFATLVKEFLSHRTPSAHPAARLAGATR